MSEIGKSLIGHLCPGLVFTTTQTINGTEYTNVRWNRVDEYLKELDCTTCGKRPDFIPENVFYRLAMKAKNEVDGTPDKNAQRLNPDEVSQADLTDKLGRQQETTIINESGSFQKKVISNALSGIIKHGPKSTHTIISMYIPKIDNLELILIRGI